MYSSPFLEDYPWMSWMRGEPEPCERLFDLAVVHLCRPPWKAWPRALQSRKHRQCQRAVFFTIHPLTYGCTCWAPIPCGILCIVTMAGYLVIEVKRVSAAGGHPETMESSYWHLSTGWRHWSLIKLQAPTFTSSAIRICVFFTKSETMETHDTASSLAGSQLFLIALTERELKSVASRINSSK